MFRDLTAIFRESTNTEDRKWYLTLIVFCNLYFIVYYYVRLLVSILNNESGLQNKLAVSIQ